MNASLKKNKNQNNAMREAIDCVSATANITADRRVFPRLLVNTSHMP